MADSIAELVAENIRTTLNGESITYNGSAHTITAERQRVHLNINGQYPYIEIGGPWAQVEERGNRSFDTTYRFSIELYENTINDEAQASTPISRITGNIHADLITLLMADITRGEQALDTNYYGYGYYMTGDPDNPMFVVYADLYVQTFVNKDNPYQLGA